MRQRFLQPLISLILLFPFVASAQYLVSFNYEGNIPASALSALGVVTVDYDVDSYSITYNTVDVNGNPTIASGMVCIPDISNCDSLPMVAYLHGTVLEKDDVPSRNNFESIIGKLFSGLGYVAVMPDYLGLGDNPGIHPYVHGESEATASVDAIRAAKEFLAQETNFNFNNQIYITGYSQGGHAAMATHKYIQENDLYDELPVVASAPCSGPYNLSGSMADIFISGDYYSNPGYVVYTLLSFQSAYGNLYQSYSNILRPPYDSIIPPMFDGTYSMSAVNNQLPNYIDSFMVDTVLANFRNDSVNQNHPLWQALNDNNNYNWIPQRPMRMYYCTADEQVPYQNSLDAQAYMLNSAPVDVRAVFSGNLSHGDCVMPAIYSASVFFDSTMVLCQSYVGVEDMDTPNSRLKVYPNPASNQLRVTGNDKEYTSIAVYSVSGTTVYQSNSSFTETTIDTQDWPEGIYFLQVMDSNKQLDIKRISIVH